MSVAKKRARKSRPKLVSLHARGNEELAGLLRHTADSIEASQSRVTGYVIITTVADGQVGGAYCSPNEVELVGAMEALKHRIMSGWG